MSVNLQDQENPFGEPAEEPAGEVTFDSLPLSALMVKLAAARKRFADVNADVTRFLASIRNANSELFDAEIQARLEMENVENWIRATALDEYAVTENKQPADGVSIAVRKTYDYIPSDALAWAKENAKVCIIPESLDTKTFAELCKSDKTRPEFVTVKEIATVRIATDLNHLLPVTDAETVTKPEETNANTNS